MARRNSERSARCGAPPAPGEGDEPGPVRRDGQSGRVLERFPSGDCGAAERWLPLLALDHPTLPALEEIFRDGDDFVVARSAPPGRPVRDGRVPLHHVPALVLQAAAILAALSKVGVAGSADDLLASVWDISARVARLWLTGSPRAIIRGGPGDPPSESLRRFLERIASRRGRVRDSRGIALLEELRASDAAWRRAEFWVGRAFRIFPELGGPSFALARLRTSACLSAADRPAVERARLEKSKAVLRGREARIFAVSEGHRVPDPGSAIGLSNPGEADAARALCRQLGSGEQAWTFVCVAIERWDQASRRAVRAAAALRPGAIELVHVPEAPPGRPPDRPILFAPCASASAGIRLSETLAAETPEEARGTLHRLLADPRWAAFAGDPTGDAPLPDARSVEVAQFAETLPPREVEALESLGALDAPADEREFRALFSRAAARLGELERRGLVQRSPEGRLRLGVRFPVSPERRPALLRRWARAAATPGRRVAFLLAAGDSAAALEAAGAWRNAEPDAPPERWFEMSARLSAAVPAPLPAWLERIEAERMIAGGCVREAESRLRALTVSRDATPDELRRAGLRLAEVLAMQGRASEAGAAAAAWRSANGSAEAAQIARALRLEAADASRAGDPDRALRLLDRADLRAASLSPAERIEIALARAAVLSRAGRFEEESAVYTAHRPLVAEAGDERTSARFLAAEALGLSDRREFPGAIARLESALEILRDDPVERAKVSIDLAATLHHAGQTERCARLLEESASIAASCGRADLARIATGNLVQAELDAGRTEAAASLAEGLLASARRDRDPLWTLVALHHRSRLALRAGHLADAARDNREARDLAESVGDRLEVGELWLENGDRAALESDALGARESWTRAAGDPPDRCDSADRARVRLEGLDAFERAERDGVMPAADLEGVLSSASASIAAGREDAALAVAAWARLVPARVPDAMLEAASGFLRSRGAAGLAALVNPASPSSSRGDADALRALRDLAAAALAGEMPEGPLPLGLRSLAVEGEGGSELLRIGPPQPPEAPARRRRLHAGSAEYLLRVVPEMPEAALDAVALLLETLLFRRAGPEAAPDFCAGWKALGVVTADASMEEPYRRLARFAPRSMTVLVLGESGSGKEAVARAVHSLSPRASARFVAVNVSAIPAALLESELFGHVRGSFTGADRDRVGLFEEAAGGTIFFDEIGDLAPSLQAKLLRVLQDREIRRVGENRARKVDVRVVSATSRDLAAEVAAGRFREDLFYRLNVAAIEIPPLRQRGRDVLLLARHFLAQQGKEARSLALDLAPESSAILLAHAWPGNVRELQSAIASSSALAEGGRVEPAHLPDAVRQGGRLVERGGRGYRSRVDAHRRDLIMEALDRAGGNRTRAARDLKLSRQALLYLIRELKVSAPGRESRRSV